MTVQVGVTGATGRMGQTVLSTIAERSDCAVAFAVNRTPEPPRVMDVPVAPNDAFDDALADRPVDVVVDFTGPESTVEYAKACAAASVPFVTGTTGLSEEQEGILTAASDRIAVMHAPNFARGIQALLAAVSDAVSALPGYDVEVVETHHNAKRDAPSGTANRLLEAIEASGEFEERTHGRVGEAPRAEAEIGVHAIRAGDITGEHEVIIADNSEAVRLTHQAEDRRVFAAGALDAAVWLAGQPAGHYDFQEVLAT